MLWLGAAVATTLCGDRRLGEQRGQPGERQRPDEAPSPGGNGAGAAWLICERGKRAGACARGQASTPAWCRRPRGRQRARGLAAPTGDRWAPPARGSAKARLLAATTRAAVNGAAAAARKRCCACSAARGRPHAVQRHLRKEDQQHRPGHTGHPGTDRAGTPPDQRGWRPGREQRDHRGGHVPRPIRSGQRRPSGARGPLAVAGPQQTGVSHRDQRARQRAAGHDLERTFGTVLAALVRRWPRQCPRRSGRRDEQRPKPTNRDTAGHHGDQPGRRSRTAASGRRRGRSGSRGASAGRRPRASSSRRPGVDSINAVKISALLAQRQRHKHGQRRDRPPRGHAQPRERMPSTRRSRSHRCPRESPAPTRSSGSGPPPGRPPSQQTPGRGRDPGGPRPRTAGGLQRPDPDAGRAG
jgi:hypothetical protein